MGAGIPGDEARQGISDFALGFFGKTGGQHDAQPIAVPGGVLGGDEPNLAGNAHPKDAARFEERCDPPSSFVWFFHALEDFGLRCIAEAQATGAVVNPLPAALLANHLLDGWEGALLRMRVERSTEPLERFQTVTFRALLV